MDLFIVIKAHQYIDLCWFEEGEIPQYVYTRKWNTG